jgi:hypothetical protein
MGGILTMPSFLNLFPVIDADATGITAAESTIRSTNQGKRAQSRLRVLSWKLTIFD